MLAVLLWCGLLACAENVETPLGGAQRRPLQRVVVLVLVVVLGICSTTRTTTRTILEVKLFSVLCRNSARDILGFGAQEGASLSHAVWGSRERVAFFF
jgi:hypothetical protein